MTKEKILEFFKDINSAYNNCNMLDSLSGMLDELTEGQRWIPVSERLPENAKHKGAFCPRCRVLTKWGETVGWYNPDKGCWYFLLWYLDGVGVDFEKGDNPKLAYEKPGATVVTHWILMKESDQE